MLQKITRLANEATLLDSSGEGLGLDISELENKIMSQMITPERTLLYLVPRRLIKVRDGSKHCGWGVVVNVVKKRPASSTLPPECSSSGKALPEMVQKITRFENEATLLDSSREGLQISELEKKFMSEMIRPETGRALLYLVPGRLFPTSMSGGTQSEGSRQSASTVKP